MPISPDLERNTFPDRIIYRLALTGGPCSGKTTGQVRLSTFFENMGWKVYRVPETATVLFSGGIRFPELDQQDADKFQENLVKTMMTIEKTFFDLGETRKQNCLIICDRGVMDASAYMSRESWERLMKNLGLNTVDVRDNRYDQVVHLITAADGAEEFYNCEDNPHRTEGVELARERDRATAQAWVGHPYIDVIDNSTNFEAKLTRMLAAVCRRIGIDAGDRLAKGSRKLKFLVGSLPPISAFPAFQDFDVIHDYLVTSNPRLQSRLRKRGQNGIWSYMHTTRRSDPKGEAIEVRRQITHRDYVILLAQRDDNHYTIYKTRRCFMWEHMYFQMDIYKSPCHARCDGLILLETYTTLSSEELQTKLPPFLDIKHDATRDPAYSMFNLSLKSDWNSTNFRPKGSEYTRKGSITVNSNNINSPPAPN